MTFADVLLFSVHTDAPVPSDLRWERDYDRFPHITGIWVLVPGSIVREVPLREFLMECRRTPLICSHNIYAQTSAVKAEVLRTKGRAWYERNGVEAILWKGKRLDTMRAVQRWVDARRLDGKLKAPNLQEVFSRCFPQVDMPGEELRALELILPALVTRGFIKLKPKEYPKTQN